MIGKRIVWSIGGSDSSCGAGVQKDLATFNDFGLHGCSVITTVTAQNSYLMKATEHCGSNIISEQIEALDQDFPPLSIKLGALGSVAGVTSTAKYLQTYKGKVICDPVLTASVGGELLDHPAIQQLVKNIFPYITLLTPNISEAEVLLKTRIQCPSDMELAAQQFLKMGVKGILIKGAHLNETIARDYFSDGKRSFWLQSPRIPKKEVHGTGCMLSSAIAATIALDYTLYDVLVIAKMYVNQAIRTACQLGKGSLFGAPLGWPSRQENLPWITINSELKRTSFPDCGVDPIGFYPIVNSVAWVERLISYGVKKIQLRIKNQPVRFVEEAIEKSVSLTKKHHVRLFINDYWELAIKHKAYGLHLGQEDLEAADIQAIQKSGLRLGISTHCFYEVARAHAYRPSYIAFGPVYATTSKPMAFLPRGLKQLSYWRKLLDYPLVAIGGINFDRLSSILSTGVDGFSVISAVTQSPNAEACTKSFLKHMAKEYA